MRPIIRTISVILSLLAVFSLYSCKKEKSEYTYDHAADFREEEGEVFTDVPRGEYGGYTFHILNAKTGQSSSKMDADSITGSILSDTIYFRNKNVEERLNITITETRDTPENTYRIATQSVMADEDLYSAVFNSAYYMGSMAAGGYLVSSDFLLKADYEKPWWKKDIMEKLSIDNTEYMLVSDMQMSFYDAHSLVAVNLDIIEKLDGLDDPFSLVENGMWTVSKMLEMIEIATSDTDGNGYMTYEDRFGISLDSSSVMPLIFGCNTKIGDVDEYDFPYLASTNDEKFFDVYTLITSSLYDGLDYVYYPEKNQADDLDDIDMFKNSRSLFIVTTVGELEEIRDIEANFGLLPMPKYSPEQKDYISFLGGNDVFALGIPASGRNFLRSGVILENLAAESYREEGLRNIYVDWVLNFKYALDEKSRENLHTVLSSTKFDLIEIYGFGGYANTIITECTSGSEKLMSTLASIERTTKKDISDFIDAIEESK